METTASKDSCVCPVKKKKKKTSETVKAIYIDQYVEVFFIPQFPAVTAE